MTTFGFGLGAATGLVTRAFLGPEVGSCSSMVAALRFLGPGAVVAAAAAPSVVFALRDFGGSGDLVFVGALIDFLTVLVAFAVRPLVAATVVFLFVAVEVFVGFAGAFGGAPVCFLGGMVKLLKLMQVRAYICHWLCFFFFGERCSNNVL